MRLQQTFLEIDEQNVDGKDLNEHDVLLLGMNNYLLERNLKLKGIAEKALRHGFGTKSMTLEGAGIDSDDLIPTQEAVDMWEEDIDGIDLSESDDILKHVPQEGIEDHFSMEIKGD